MRTSLHPQDMHMLPLAAVLAASSLAAPPAPHIVYIMADDTGVRNDSNH
eukprot:SAG22_NODE_1168_length_5271_cov_13.249613_2_plen_49_part_00